MPSLKNQAIRGTIWTLAGYGGGQTLRLGGNLLLTRLLVPELFGLMALVQTFIIGLTLFSDIGIRPAIIRSSRWQDEKFLNTAWTMQVIRGCWIWLGCLLVAWPVAKFYGDDRLIWLLPLVGLTALISGFNSTSLAVLNRKMEVGKLTRFEAIAQAVTLLVMVVWAYFRPSIWALVIGNLVGSVLKLVWSHRIDPDISNRFAWEKSSLRELVSFGQWIFISTAMTFVATQADRLILGRLFSLEFLGIYTVAFTFADLPRQIAQKVASQVVFPVISRYTHLDRSELRLKVLRKRRFLLLGLASLVALLASFGDLLVLTLYDERYQQASWMLPVLALGLWPFLLSATIDKTLFAIGKPKFVALGNFLKFLYMIILLPLAYKEFGVLGAVVVVTFNDLPFYAAVNYGLWREKLGGTQQDIAATLLLCGLTLTIWGIRYTMGFGLPIDNIL
ncbi:MAG: oligosaccharide flippase family protein [Oscillatoriales cyanobacterium SM2_3_0]|nr:oligosaccharide flippase family protein [Oscillatoriales cyanobacterium SM2_3_0]